MRHLETIQPEYERLKRIATERLGNPRYCEILTWQDDDYAIHVRHAINPETRETIAYKNSRGQVVYWLEHDDGDGFDLVETEIVEERDHAITNPRDDDPYACSKD